MPVDLDRLIKAMDEYEKRPKCETCSRPRRDDCDGKSWLEAIGPCADGSYITSRPCPNV